MNKVDLVRALFVEGETIECVENTYIPKRNGSRWVVGKVGKSYWRPASGENFQGNIPTRAGDVVAVDERSATWRIGRDDHTVTYAKAAR